MVQEILDQDLIARIARNEQEAFRYLVEKYKDMVFRTCLGLLHDTPEAEDITQDVFLEVYRSVSFFRGESKLSTWLYRIAINKSLNQMKRNQKKKSWLRLDELVFSRKPEKKEISIPDLNNSQPLEREELGAVLRKAINELPENQQIAFVLAKYDELSYKEISDIMNTSVSSVESLVHRAKTNLQKMLINIYKSYQ